MIGPAPTGEESAAILLKHKGYTVIAPGVITVTISRADFDSLKEDAETLRKLENAGVDNWTWYGEALNHPEDFE